MVKKNPLLWLKKTNKTFGWKQLIVFGGGPLNTLKIISTISFQDLCNTIFWSCRLRWFCTVRRLNICVTRNLFLIKIQKQGFRQKNSKKATQIFKCPPKKNSEWFSIKIIDPIRFMKLLWSIISTNWCFQKIIGSGLALCWSDTPQNIFWKFAPPESYKECAVVCFGEVVFIYSKHVNKIGSSTLILVGTFG